MNPIVYAIPVFMLTIVLEAWWAWRKRLAVYDIPDAVTSLHHGLLSQVMGVFTKFGIYALVYEPFVPPSGPWSHGGCGCWRWCSTTFCYYWAHRMGHEVNVLWASHVVHHSSEYYNLDRLAPDLQRLVVRLDFLPAHGGGWGAAHHVRHSRVDRPALPVLGAHRTGGAHGLV
jgi:hypothetical protein